MRSHPDRCPGVLRLHQAQDGALARIRIPAGLLDAGQARLILGIATDLGDGAIDLTSRGNVQLRGLSADAAPELSDRLFAAGLLPSVVHERARNILASPLAGLDSAGLDGGGHAGVQGWARSLDALICATPALAGLSGRFLFGLDDGRGDIVGLHADITLVARADGRADLLLAGEPTGIRVISADVPGAAAVAAGIFLEVRAQDGPGAGPGPWRISELGASRATMLDALRDALPWPAGGIEAARPAAGPPLGVIRQPDGLCAVSAGLPLGHATARQWGALVEAADAGSGELRLTPWRGAVAPGLSADAAAEQLASLGAAGLVTSDGSPWTSATACTGRPGCANALADVRADATAALAAAASQPRGIPTLLPVHWSGCERRCGRPAARHLDVVADETGYLIRGSGSRATPRHVMHEEMAAATSAARRTM